jgi:hypothetical protein
MKYRAGHGEERMTPLSVEYCRRVRTHLAAIGSPFAAGTHAVSVSPTFDASSAAADTAATSDVAGSMNRTKSARTESTQVLPPQRPLKESKAAAAGRLKVPVCPTSLFCSRARQGNEAEGDDTADVGCPRGAHAVHFCKVEAREPPDLYRNLTIEAAGKRPVQPLC